MPSLGIATVQPSLQYPLIRSRFQTLVHSNVLPNQWKSPIFPKNINLYTGNIRRGNLLITAIATLEPKCPIQEKNEQKSLQLVVDSSPSKDKSETSSGDSENLNDREWLRRTRISKANKGNTPWNKGRKHSAETLRRIRERTKLAMQNPKIRMKLATLGHAQTEETRLKIALGVRMKWERKREQQMLQEACCFEWQNLIAEASRRGYINEEELQWDSYKLLDEELKKEWFEGIEERKTTLRTKDSRRAPKSPQQRRRIAEAIAAKWADPDYRERVCSSLAKYHGSPSAVERMPKRKPSAVREFTRQSPVKKTTSDTNISSMRPTRSQIQQLRLRKSNKPVYKDHLASSKLNIIKNIRAERAAAESKRTEALAQARLLIAEAEKAAKALEDGAMKSSVAQASLIETRKLIAEAIHSIKSIESRKIIPNENGMYPSVVSTQPIGQHEKYQESGVNGTQILKLRENDDSGFAKVTVQGILDGGKGVISSNINHHSLATYNLDGEVKQSMFTRKLGKLESNGNTNWEKNLVPNGNTDWEKNLLLNGTKFHILERNGDTGYGSIKQEKGPLPNGSRVHSAQPNGNIKCANRNSTLLNGAKPIVMERELASKAVTVTKKWVRGRLVEVTEGA